MRDLSSSRGRGRVLLYLWMVFVRQICINANKNETTNTTKTETEKEMDRVGLTGAVPEENLNYKIAIACQGSKLYIACTNIYDRIQIKTSFYGRQDFTTCKHPELPSNKICAEQNTTVQNLVADLCQGESLCEVSVTNDFLAQFGTIICPNIYKYLYVKYRCVPTSALPAVPLPYVPIDGSGSLIGNSTVVTPLHCCYVVTGASAGTGGSASQGGGVIAGGGVTGGGGVMGGGVIQSGGFSVSGGSVEAETIGGTITRQKGGIQSVEERIVSEKPQVPPIPRVTEIINGANPSLVAQPQRPATSSTRSHTPQVELSTLLQGQAKRLRMSNLISVDPSQLGNVIAKPYKREFIPRTVTNRKKEAIPASFRYSKKQQLVTLKNRKRGMPVSTRNGQKQQLRNVKSRDSGIVPVSLRYGQKQRIDVKNTNKRVVPVSLRYGEKQRIDVKNTNRGGVTVPLRYNKKQQLRNEKNRKRRVVPVSLRYGEKQQNRNRDVLVLSDKKQHLRSVNGIKLIERN